MKVGRECCIQRAACCEKATKALCSTHGGFTLLEVMISLAIMAGVILTVISSFNYHLSVVSRDQEETAAVLLARAKLDDPAFAVNQPAKGTFAPDRPEISWETTVTPAKIPGAAGLLNQVTMTVSWDAERRKVSLVKYVSAP